MASPRSVGGALVDPRAAKHGAKPEASSPTDKKNTMSTITKLISGSSEARQPRAGVLDHVKRALHARADRRAHRPLQDLDTWSDQSEVDYYERCRSSLSL